MTNPSRMAVRGIYLQNQVIVRVLSTNNRKVNGNFEEKFSLLGSQFSPITSS
jgi:hypothetical protein